jgi:hypothetical protein
MNFTTTLVIPGNTYQFKIRARNIVGLSFYSSVIGVYAA